MLFRRKPRPISGAEALEAAIDAGNHAEIARMLEAGQSPNVGSSKAYPPLCRAIRKEDPEAVRLLIRHGANVRAALRRIDASTGPGTDELLDVLRRLLDAGAIPDEAPVRDLVRREIAWMAPLLATGGDDQRRDGYGTPLDSAAMYAGPEHMAAMLECAGPLSSETVQHLIYLAAYHGQTATLALLSRWFGVSPRVEDACSAAWRGRDDNLRFILESGVSARAVDAMAVLHAAANAGSLSCLELLLDHGADIEARDEFGGTALMRAAYHRHPAAVEYLLSRGADREARDRHGRTAVEHARAGLASDVFFGSTLELAEPFHAVLAALGVEA